MGLFFYVKNLAVSFLFLIFVIRKMSQPHMFDRETHQFILIPRHSSCRQWRAAPFGACLARRITKMAKHSNPVIRSLFISTVRLFQIEKRIFRDSLLFYAVYVGSFLSSHQQSRKGKVNYFENKSVFIVGYPKRMLSLCINKQKIVCFALYLRVSILSNDNIFFQKSIFTNITCFIINLFLIFFV